MARASVVDPATPSLPITLDGRYRLDRALGRGSSAQVYAATDLRLNRPVVVKLFDRAVTLEPGLRQRFERQASRAAGLRHPHIAALLDAGFSADLDGGERAFVVTEPAGSRTLRERLDRGGRLPAERAVRLVRQVASALAYAHRRGLVHADVKPENVILDAADEHARLVDFSLSFVAARTGLVTPQTITRRAAYLAPEQVRGEPVGPASDVYALGVLLYEALTGRPPFLGSTPQATADLRVQQAARPSGVFEPTIPPRLEAIIGRALEREAPARWGSVDDFERALAGLDPQQLAAASGREAAQLDTRWPAPARPRGLRRRRSALGTIIPVLGVAAALTLGLSLIGPLAHSVPDFAAPFRHGYSTVPDVVGQPLARAQASAHEQGFELAVLGDRPSDHYAKGVVIQQSPVAGSQPDAVQPLRVTLSSGVSVPDERGKTLADARADLEAAGWHVKEVGRQPQPGAAPDTVVLQWPPPGQPADAPADVTLILAQ